jgi:hypothetical protein
MADSLSESARRDRDPRPGFAGTGLQYQDSAIVAVNPAQRPRIHGHAGHCGAGLLARRLMPSTSSAHLLSWRGQLPASICEGISQHGTPINYIVKGDTDGVLDEPRQARGSPSS